jgi:hypothetical protein
MGVIKNIQFGSKIDLEHAGRNHGDRSSNPAICIKDDILKGEPQLAMLGNLKSPVNTHENATPQSQKTTLDVDVKAHPIS